MSHTTNLAGTHVIHNGDWSGNVSIKVDREDIDEGNGYVDVPMSVILEIAGLYVRDELISHLEQSEPKDILMGGFVATDVRTR
jgi:hypothetical protein